MKYCVGKELIGKIPARDDIDFRKLTGLQLELVDHHKLIQELEFLSTRIRKIVDHRVLDRSAIFPQSCHSNIKLVGSCSTLVAEEVMKQGYKVNFAFVNFFLVSPDRNLFFLFFRTQLG